MFVQQVASDALQFIAEWKVGTIMTWQGFEGRSVQDE
jgi:hypothetical protein